MFRHLRLLPLSAIAILVFATSPAEAQKNDGFAQSSGVTISVAEMAGATQKQPDGTPPKELFLPGYPNLWVMELQYKPIRMIRMPVRDPKTGQTNRELIWYMVWRATRRDYTDYFNESDKDTIIKQLRDPALEPVNPKDPKANMVFAPHFTLVTEDSKDKKIYKDWVLAEVQAAIARRERIRLQNTVQAIQPVPKLAEDKSQQKVIEGVAVWRNVDPKTDYLGVFMTGFSNGYRVGKDPNGNTVLERKTVYQRFWRPGDEFEQDEQEFRIEGKPKWLYRPEPWSAKWPSRLKTPIQEIMSVRPDARPDEILEQGLGG